MLHVFVLILFCQVDANPGYVNLRSNKRHFLKFKERYFKPNPNALLPGTHLVVSIPADSPAACSHLWFCICSLVPAYFVFVL